jgi:hypothetical protein
LKRKMHKKKKRTGRAGPGLDFGSSARPARPVSNIGIFRPGPARGRPGPFSLALLAAVAADDAVEGLDNAAVDCFSWREFLCGGRRLVIVNFFSINGNQ